MLPPHQAHVPKNSAGVLALFSEKYNGKYSIRPLLLTGRSKQLNFFTRLLHFYCCFRKYPYWPPLTLYSRMALWPYDHILAIWMFGVK